MQVLLRQRNLYAEQYQYHQLLDIPVSESCTTHGERNSSGRTWPITSFRQYGAVQRVRVILNGLHANDICNCSPQPELSTLTRWISLAHCRELRTKTYSSYWCRSDTRSSKSDPYVKHDCYACCECVPRSVYPLILYTRLFADKNRPSVGKEVYCNNIQVPRTEASHNNAVPPPDE